MTALPLPAPLLAAVALAFVVGSFLLLRAIDQQERVRARLSRLSSLDAGGSILAPKRDSMQLLDLVAKFGATIAKSGVLSDSTRAQLEQTINQAGLRGSRVFGLFFGSKILLMFGMPTLAYLLIRNAGFTTTTYYAILGGSFALGMLAPDFFIKRMRGAHLKKVERGLPDALDMMVICAQAGLALENAVERVAQEFQFANQAVAMELAICASELRIGTDRRTALMSLGDLYRPGVRCGAWPAR